MLTDQLEGCGWTDLGNLVEIIAPEKNAEVDELKRKNEKNASAITGKT